MSLKISINSSSQSRKKYDGDNFTPTPRKRLQGQNTSVGIGLIELNEPSDTLNYRPFFKHCILQTVLHIFFCLHLCGTKSFVLKTKLYFTFFFFLIWFGLAFVVTVLKVLCFWCSFIRLKGFISYIRYNLLGVFREK